MDLAPWGGLDVYVGSVVQTDRATYSLVGQGAGNRCLALVGESAGFAGERQGQFLLCPLSPANAAVLRARLPWLRPVPLGVTASAGLGDRLGLATPGHARAARHFGAIAPIFAQQSVRENARTGRTPQEVLDDAMWGLLQEGWSERWGADADHLKTVANVDSFVQAGYTLFTVDPGDHVDHTAQSASPAELEAKVGALPWEELEDTARDTEKRYLDRHLDLEGFSLVLDREALQRAAVKYGRAVAHTVRLYRHLAGRLAPGQFELEVSVDETETPTSPGEHYYIASELRRLGVRWVSLAPRFVGSFEKGVDYIGDLDVFSRELARHAAVAQALGPYKLSLHSGSDKFSIYSIAARCTGGLVHLKTAGTSYLEALRAIAQIDPAFFRAILSQARTHYEQDRATYHVSGQLALVPPPEALSDAALPSLLDQFDARQVLHVTFGTVLDRFRDRLLATLKLHQERYFTLLENHFIRHLDPFFR
jgi:hypothetical protein